MPKKPAPPCPFVAEAEQLRAAKEVIESFVSLWIGRLGLEHWALKQQFHTGLRPDSPDTAACTYSDWKYKHATVEFYLGVMASMGAEEQELVVVHELLHVILNEIHGATDENRSEDDRAHEERVVTELTQAFLRIARG